MTELWIAGLMWLGCMAVIVGALYVADVIEAWTDNATDGVSAGRE